MSKYLSMLLVGGALLHASTTLDIYKDRMRLNEWVPTNSSGNYNFIVPSHLDLNDIDIIGDCEITSKFLSEEVIVEDKVYEKLQNDFTDSSIKLTTLKSQEALLRSASLQDVTNMDSIDKISKKISDSLLKNLKEQVLAEKDIKQKKEALDKYLLENPPAKTKTLTLGGSCDAKSGVGIAYDFVELESAIVKKANANTKNSEIKIDEVINLKNISSIELENINIRSLATYYAGVSKPFPFYPEYLDVPSNSQQEYAIESRTMLASPQALASQKSTKSLSQGTQLTLGTLNGWEFKDVSIPRGENTELNLSSQALNATFNIFIDGYASNMAFVEGIFTPTKMINAGDTRFYLDSFSVSNYYVNELASDIEQRLYFGVNNHISVTKKHLKDFTENSVFGSKTRMLRYEYEIKNNSQKEEKIILSERLPISKNEKITVTLVSNETPTKQKEDGEVWFEFILKPNESKKIEFGYDVKSPK